jgi:phosphatidate cytidylyltransferase
MNWSSPVTHHVLLVVFGVLGIASLIGFILSRRATSAESKATVANLNARTNSWWVMVLVIFSALSFPFSRCASFSP